MSSRLVSVDDAVIKEHVFPYLDPQSLARLKSTDKRWKKLSCEEDDFWAGKIREQFPSTHAHLLADAKKQHCQPRELFNRCLKIVGKKIEPQQILNLQKRNEEKEAPAAQRQSKIVWETVFKLFKTSFLRAVAESNIGRVSETFHLARLNARFERATALQTPDIRKLGIHEAIPGLRVNRPIRSADWIRRAHELIEGNKSLKEQYRSYIEWEFFNTISQQSMSEALFQCNHASSDYTFQDLMVTERMNDLGGKVGIMQQILDTGAATLIEDLDRRIDAE